MTVITGEFLQLEDEDSVKTKSCQETKSTKTSAIYINDLIHSLAKKCLNLFNETKITG